MANSGEPNQVFLNFEKGTIWKKISLKNAKLSTYDIIITDLNNDQRLDIIESNSDDINFFYRNILKIKKD